jgi:hypothetical protein
MKALLILAFLATTIVGGTSVQAQQPELRRTLELEETQFMRPTSASSFTQARQVMLEAKLIAIDASNGALFGNSVAISGDTAVIGAYWNHIGTRRWQGSVYVFVRKGQTWIQQAKLVAADGKMKDHFGQSVAIDGDTIVVGVPEADIGEDKNQGAVYVFTRQGDHWAEQVKLTASGGASIDIFGKTVGISGDTIIVGAPGADNTPNDKLRQAHGAAYVFTRSNNVWTQRQKLTGDHPSSVVFGMNVAISNKTAVVSSGRELGSSDIIYVFTNEGTGWKQEAKISSPSADEKLLSNSVSYNLAIDGSTIVVGGTQKGDKSDSAVYVHVRDNGKWTRQTKLAASDGVKGDMFGWTVDISGDTVIVGAANGGNKFVGAAYLFHRKLTPTGTVWVEQQKLTAADSGMADHFGSGVGISNDTIVVGADNHDFKIPNSNRGTAYIFTGPLSSARSAASSPGQRSFAHSVGQSGTRRIPLIRNATKNGYTTTQEGNTIYFQAVNVADPSGNKLLAGLKQLEYQCSPNRSPTTVNLQFSNGHSDRINVSCLALIKPRVLVMEERSEPN